MSVIIRTYNSATGLAARNTGIRLTQGDYVALLGSDDIWELWRLELQLFIARPGNPSDSAKPPRNLRRRVGSLSRWCWRLQVSAPDVLQDTFGYCRVEFENASCDGEQIRLVQSRDQRIFAASAAEFQP